MYQNLKKKTEGFTIIEVLIVLAIAGLIMLIVFLAVPALQRNQRNSNRDSDASRVSTLVTECLANRNGVVDACDDEDKINFSAADFSAIETVDINNGNSTETGSETEARVEFGAVCTDTGDASVDGSSSRQFVVKYVNEPGVNRCIGSE